MNTTSPTANHNQSILQAAMVEKHRRAKAQQEVTASTSIKILPLTKLDRRRFDQQYVELINDADTPLDTKVRRRLRRQQEQEHTPSTDSVEADIDMDAETDFSSLEDEDENIEWQDVLLTSTPPPVASDDDLDPDDEEDAGPKLNIDVDMELEAAFGNLDVNDELLSADPAPTPHTPAWSAPPSTWVEWMALLSTNQDEFVRQSRHNREEVMENLVREAQAEVSQKRRDRSRSRSPTRMTRTTEMYRERDYSDR